jgi:hypothetical protein
VQKYLHDLARWEAAGRRAAAGCWSNEVGRRRAGR